MKMGNSIVETWSNSIASVEVLWIYSGESEIVIWTTSKGPVSHFLSFLPPRKTMKLIKTITDQK